MAWLEEEGDVRRMLQGLIQVTAGYFKATVHGRPGGSAKLLAAGLAKLELVPDSLGGLGLAPFRREVSQTLEEIRRRGAGERGDFNRAQVPRLELAPEKE